jgi:hypothetical protein
MITPDTPVPSTFLYHAHASALGGAITRPVVQPINAPAVSVLTASGGYQSTVVDGYRLENILSFSKAVTQVSGSKGSNAYNAFASVEIEGLNIENEVTADRIVGKLSTTTPFDGDMPEFSVGGCQFINLRIGGVLIEPVLAIDLYTRLNKLSTLDAAWADPKNKDYNDLRTAVRQWYLPQAEIDKEEKDPNAYPIKPQEKTRDGMIRCSLIKEFSGSLAHVTRTGMMLQLPNFGKIIIGEMFIGKYTRRLNMIRMQLGSPVEGDGTVGNLDLNGITYP